MVRNLGVKETRCPPCRSDFSELQLCHAKSNEQRFATSNNSACSRSSRLRLWRQLLRNISLSPFLSRRKNSLLLLSALLSPLFFWKHLATVRRTRLPIKSMPRKEGTLLWGARGQSFEFLFSRVSWKIPLNVYPRLRIVPRLFWNGRKVSIAGVWPFLTGQREGGRERMEREKSRNGRYFSCKEEKPLCHRIFHFSKSFAIYFHVSRFFHLWSRDTKYGGKSERLKRFKSLESKTLPGWFLRRWVRERKRDFLFFFSEEVQATTNHYVYPMLVAW